MTYAFSLNGKPATFGEALFDFKEALVAGGWTVESSGDGVAAFNGSGDVHAPGGPYAGTLDNQNSWYRVRGPVAMSPRREFVVHNNSASGGAMTWVYSSDGTGFTGGAPSATVRPTAADEQLITDITTFFFFNSADGSYRFDIMVGDAGENFSFFMGTRLQNGTEAALGYNMCLYLDVLDDANASDPDGAIVGCVYDGDAARFAQLTANPIDFGQSSALVDRGSSRGWYDKGVTDSWVNYPITFISAEGGFGHIPRAQEGAGINDAGEVEELSVWYVRSVAPVGIKGRSHLFKVTRLDVGAGRPEGGSTPFARLNMGLVSIPWDGATRPVW